MKPTSTRGRPARPELNLSTRQLRAFMALAKALNFTRAAEQLHLSQPAFSALIRSLEETLSARLFDRDTRRVQLTAAGLRFHRAAREVLACFDATMAEVCRDLDAVQRLTVAAMPSLCARLLPAVVATFRHAHPHVDIHIVDALPQRCVDMVREGSADIALTSLGAEDRDIDAQLLCTDTFFAVCHHRHPLAAKTRIALEHLVQHPFIHFASQTRLRQQIDAALHQREPNTVLEVERLEAVKGLIESDIGVGVVPGLTLFHFASDQIAIRPLQPPGVSRDIFLLQAKQPEARTLRTELAHAVRTHTERLVEEAGITLPDPVLMHDA